ncbi:hypothetical protein H8356DRAFT_1071986 [Neocallimastix lanati (nom. inval.)]|nr:hypothetical protein H8356DRAFT_1071986 [Neocallimastix sp. JGI-2020a]
MFSYIDSLHDEVKCELLMRGDKARTLLSAFHMAMIIDSNLRRKYQVHKGYHGASIYNPFVRKMQNEETNPFVKKNKHEEQVNKRRGPLSTEEKQRRRDKGLCIYCGVEDHMMSNLPLSSKKLVSRKILKILNIRLKNTRKNTKNIASNNEEINKTIEDHVENDDSDEFFDIIDDEKIFNNNKNFNDFEQKIENNDKNNNDKNNNNLSSKIFHEKLNVSQNDNPNLPNIETKENSNFNNKVENSINNKVKVNKNLIDNSLNNSNNNEEKQYTDIISDSKLVHIENESKINSNSNNNSKEYTDNILNDKVDFTSSPNVNKTHFNLNPKGKRKELIIYKNVNVPQDILKLKKIINNINFKLNKFKNFNFDYNPNNNISVILNKNNKRPLEDNSILVREHIYKTSLKFVFIKIENDD